MLTTATGGQLYSNIQTDSIVQVGGLRIIHCWRHSICRFCYAKALHASWPSGPSWRWPPHSTLPLSGHHPFGQLRHLFEQLPAQRSFPRSPLSLCRSSSIRSRMPPAPPPPPSPPPPSLPLPPPAWPRLLRRWSWLAPSPRPTEQCRADEPAALRSQPATLGRCILKKRQPRPCSSTRVEFVSADHHACPFVRSPAVMLCHPGSPAAASTPLCLTSRSPCQHHFAHSPPSHILMHPFHRPARRAEPCHTSPLPTPHPRLPTASAKTAFPLSG